MFDLLTIRPLRAQMRHHLCYRFDTTRLHVLVAKGQKLEPCQRLLGLFERRHILQNGLDLAVLRDDQRFASS
jgi:hypothetical protein